MRIALTVDPELPVPPQHYGGIERIVDMLARGLAVRGHTVTLFASPDSTCPVQLVAWPGRTSGSIRDTIRNAAVLAYHVATSNFDIIHSFSRLAYLVPLLPIAVPKLMSYQREICQRTTSGALKLARGTLEYSAISRRMIEVEPLNGRWHLVPNGVPLDTYAFQPEVAPDAPFVFLGRIEKIKGPDLAIEIARAANRRLILAGNIPTEHLSWFQNKVAQHIDGVHVQYVGPVNDQQKCRLLGSAAALLMPISWEEPFGIVMAEAMACGTPVLGLNRGAVSEVVEHGVTGFIADTATQLSAAALRVAELSRAAARARVEKLYSADTVTDSYLSVYAGIILRMQSS